MKLLMYSLVYIKNVGNDFSVKKTGTFQFFYYVFQAKGKQGNPFSSSMFIDTIPPKLLEPETTVSIASTTKGGCSPVLDDVQMFLQSAGPSTPASPSACKLGDCKNNG